MGWGVGGVGEWCEYNSHIHEHVDYTEEDMDEEMGEMAEMEEMERDGEIDDLCECLHTNELA